MASPVEASAVPSSLAEQYLQEGAQYIQEGLSQQAKRAFGRAVAEDAGLARSVADYYDLLGDTLAGPQNIKRRREYYGAAKEFYKRLLREPAPGAFAPQQFRADLDVRIGNAYNKLSSLHGGAYNAHDTERAIAYFNAAVEELGELHMEQAHQGRLLALAKKLGQGQVRRWYQGGSHFEAPVLTAALQDLSTLYSLPASASEIVERFAAAAALFTYPVDAASQAVITDEIIPQMGSYLWQPAPNDAHAAVQGAVLVAFAKLLQKHSWASDQVAPHLQAFVRNGDIRFDQIADLEGCYRALIGGNKAYAGNLVTDLEELRQQYAGQPGTLGAVVQLAHHFITLRDAIEDETAPRSAAQTIFCIGRDTQSTELLRSTVDALVYGADTYDGLATDCVRYLGDLAVAHDKPSSPCRKTAQNYIRYHLLCMRRVPHLTGVVMETLFEKLGVQAEDLLALPPNPPRDL